MKNGYIKLYRTILENPISRKPDYAWLWTIMLLKANHKDNEILWNSKKMKLKAGQFITGRKELSVNSGISESKVYRILKYLKNEQQIEQQTTNKFTIITILNWKKYQGSEQQIKQPVNNKRTTSEQQSEHRQEERKNDKKDKKNIYTDIFNYWNSKEIIKHKILDDSTKRKIIAMLKVYTPEEIKKAINIYSVIIKDEDDEYYFHRRHTLKNFLNWKFEEFKDAEVAHESFLKFEKKGK